MLILITRGHTSSYSIWSAMKEEAKRKSNPKKVLAYKNIHQRALNLLKHGYLEEIKFDLINMHGRRDYKLTLKGMKQLLPYIKNHPDNLKNLVEYMDKIKFPKESFVSVLINELSILRLDQKTIASALNLFQKYVPNEYVNVSYDKDGNINKIEHGSARSKLKQQRLKQQR
jgi:hypothetical protein